MKDDECYSHGTNRTVATGLRTGLIPSSEDEECMSIATSTGRTATNSYVQPWRWFELGSQSTCGIA